MLARLRCSGRLCVQRAARSGTGLRGGAVSAPIWLLNLTFERAPAPRPSVVTFACTTAPSQPSLPRIEAKIN